MVPNTYTLLSTLNPGRIWYSVLYLKDTFFCALLVLESQYVFAFEWQDPDSRRKQQLCWTVLPQGFKNSPTLSGKVLAKDLGDLELEQETIFQYEEDILIASPTKELSNHNIINTLNHLAEREDIKFQTKSPDLPPADRILRI